MVLKITKRRDLSMLLVLVLMVSMLVVPAVAEAGIISSALSSLRPFLQVGGKVAGAVVGGTLCSGFVPPLGMIAGGLAGWMIGGIISNYGTSSIGNLATLAGAAAGAMALSSLGPIGYVAGAIGGGWIGKWAMGLLKSTDPGGILFSQQPSMTVAGSSGPTVYSGSVPALSAASPMAAGPSVIPQASYIPTSEEIRQADQEYQAAYQLYLKASRSGDASEIKAANEQYQQALENYRAMIGSDPVQ